MGLRTRSLVVRCGVALLIAALAFLIRLALRPLIGTTAFTFITFFPTVILSAWWLGFAPGVVTTMAASSLSLLILPPTDSFAVQYTSHLSAVAIFAITGVALSTLATRFHGTVQDLEQANDRLTVAQVSGGAGVWDWSFQDGVIYWSDSFRQICGLESDVEATYENWLLTLEESARAPTEAKVRALLADPSQESLEIEYTVQRPTLDTRWVQVRGRIERAQDGQPTRLVGILLDVTEQRRDQLVRNQLAAIVESSDDAIIGLSLDTIVNSWNSGAERLFGYSAEEMVGGSIATIVPNERSDEDRDFVERIAAGERLRHYETVRLTKDGRQVHVSLTASPIRDGFGRLVGVSKVARDITDQKHARHALELADRRKDEFIAMLSHEVRNPLAAIETAAAVLGLTSDPEAASSAASVIHRQVKQLSSMMEDLLDVSRIRTGKITLAKHPLHLSRVVNETVDAIRSRALTLQHRLLVDCENVWVNGDEHRLVQIVENLVGNALKYTAPGGDVRVSVRRDGEEAVIEVRDTGVGISPETLPHIFDLFVQEESSMDRSKGGLGLGLTLVKRLAELHDGCVTASSQGIDRGACFTVRMPTVAEEHRPEERTSAKSQVEGKRVLIVEDNPDAREVLRMLLELAGHEVYEAMDGASGLRAALELRPDVALVDLGLPTMDGFDVARHIRSAEHDRHMKLVAVSGYGQPEDQRRSREAGFDSHLVKPVDLDQLNRLLESDDTAPTPLLGRSSRAGPSSRRSDSR